MLPQTDGKYHVHDFKCPEFEQLVSCKGLSARKLFDQMSVLFRTLEELWNVQYANFR